jgi:Probable zinc-ribbon domain
MTGVKSGKLRRTEIRAGRKVRKAKLRQRLVADRLTFRRAMLPPQGTVAVDAARLSYWGYGGPPEFVETGFYEDRPFTCRDCGAPQVWTALQQKWWYEVAGGDPWSKAVRCRPCRRVHRVEAAAHKARSEAGRARKAAKAGGQE